MVLRFTAALVLSFICLAAPAWAIAQVQTFTATHTYVMADHDSKDDARQRCLLETKRKILEHTGVYIESASDVKNSDLPIDKIISSAAVMQVKDIKEEVGLENGHMSLTLTLNADVDLAEVRKQLAARHLDAGVREDVTVQEERLKYLEAKFEMLRRQQQVGQAPGHAQAAPPIDISAEA